ncbi:hypothetical protein [Pseudomonas siliginis]|uniref:hypothetical protein n=1 Tax=Pseudomonas siliginis TaxID=2842346 RepID=UPI002093E958|nr:hypothetical protein [Pseudomonas siliginis]UST77213.1 hypothetical protein NF676_00085 [Pseudomonas siliginis]
MGDLESAFAQLLGRQPSEKEIQELYRAKNALNIRDNDSLWLILMALQSYDTLFSKYPAMISTHSKHIMEDIRRTAAEVSEAESRKALGTLSEAVSHTSQVVAVNAVAASRYQFIGMCMIGLVMFGALCTFVGFVLGTGRMPYWAIVTDSQHPFIIVISAIARTPAGWLASIAGCIAVACSIWKAKKDIIEQKRYGLLASGIFLLTLSASLLYPFI